MNRRTVLEVALPVVGAWCLIHALQRGVSYLALCGWPPVENVTPSFPRWLAVLSGVVFGVCLAVMGYLLLHVGRGVARRLAAGPGGADDEHTLDTQRRTFTLAMKVIGVWYALGVLPMVLQSLARPGTLWSYPREEPSYNWWYLAAAVIVLAASCYFVSGGARLARWTFRGERGNPT
ncbi:MAG TPA: hypothetical protein VMW52_05985 [Phycisphaerae bacterium]|nr:hypothetical protein [Phycisphaerae bacterium]